MTRLLDALRILLGAVMMVTATRYFLPPLLPFLPVAQWHDPMAVRLMAAFDTSGLLAVAKLIHFAGGALLLCNRAVPFALAALLPVNVCGLYITLFVEADALLGLLAVLTVALNAVLMLAYLPSYGGVLQKRALADGEATEDGQNFESLYVNPFSEAPPRAYAAAATVLVAALAFYWFVVPFANGTMGLYVLAIPSLLLLTGSMRALMQRSRSGG